MLVFQPHRYTRTRDLFNDFVTAFNDADTLILTDIYAAGEKEIEGITGKRLFEEIERHGHRDITFIPDRNDLPAFLCKKARAGDMVITMGAGNIWEAGSLFLDEINKKSWQAATPAAKGKK